MGVYESRMAVVLIAILEPFVQQRDLGMVFGADATLRLLPGLVRLPDVSYCHWAQFPDRLLPAAQMPDLYPDLAVEVLSPSNTRAEMARKRREYFAAGTRLVWEVNPGKRTVTVYTAPDESSVLTEADTLDGGTVLPGFSLPIRDWFERAGRRQPE